ncbi:MAG: hypothetical protein WCF90_08450, partial [Methanomicrobiales archaeon]
LNAISFPKLFVVDKVYFLYCMRRLGLEEIFRKAKNETSFKTSAYPFYRSGNFLGYSHNFIYGKYVIFRALSARKKIKSMAIFERQYGIPLF